MGKFLRDARGNLVAIEGGLVLERTLDRKPRDCESCGYSKWVKKDKVFIIQGGSGAAPSSPDNINNNNTSPSSSSASASATNPLNPMEENGVLGGYVGGGSMEWICPDCALNRGLPIEFYHKNFYAPGNAEARHQKKQQKQKQNQAGNKNKWGAGGRTLPEGIEKLLDLTSSLCHF